MYHYYDFRVGDKFANRDLTQNTTATSTRTSPNKRFNEQNNKTVHVRYNCRYISLPSSAKHQREILRGLNNVNPANFSRFYLELNAFVTGTSSNKDKRSG